MPLPDPDTYRQARLDARAARLALDRRAVLRIHAALRRYTDELEALLRDAFPDARIRAGILEADLLEESIRINDLTARRLLRALIEAIADGREVSFSEVLEIWEAAGRQAAASVGGLGLIGGLRIAPVTLLGAYESAGGAATWRTLLRNHVANAAAEADAIVRGALTEGVGIDELSRRMRRYVVGSEPFDALFEEVPTLSGKVVKIDLRRLRGDARQAAREMEYNARRIAISEVGNARREAEVQHMTNDPLIKAVRWRLSPFRGDLIPPDACDLLAMTDFYGLGPGVFPVLKVPTEPHPQGYCLEASTPVLTAAGWKPVSEIVVGEQVLTHRGRFQPVVGVHHGPITDGWMEMGFEGQATLTITADHPIRTNQGWKQAGLFDLGESAVCLDRLPDDNFDELVLGWPALRTPRVPREDKKLPPGSLQSRLLSGVVRSALGLPVPATVDFYRKHDRGDGNVDVVPLEWVQRFDAGDAGAFDAFTDSDFVLRQLALVGVDRVCDPSPVGFGLRLPRKALGSKRREALASAIRCLFPSGPLGHFQPAAGDPKANQILAHDESADPEHLGHAILGQMLLDIELSKTRLVKNVRRLQFVNAELRHVRHLSGARRRYCLTIAKDNSFVAGGVVVHNCEQESVVRDLREAALPKPNPVRILRVDQVPIPRQAELTDARIRQIREQTEFAVRFGEEAARRAA